MTGAGVGTIARIVAPTITTTIGVTAGITRNYYRHYDRDNDFGEAAAATIFGLAAGAIVGGIAAGGGDDGSYSRCQARYRSFDADSWTYLGYDGDRHYCRL